MNLGFKNFRETNYWLKKRYGDDMKQSIRNREEYTKIEIKRTNFRVH